MLVWFCSFVWPQLDFFCFIYFLLALFNISSSFSEIQWCVSFFPFIVFKSSLCFLCFVLFIYSENRFKLFCEDPLHACPLPQSADCWGQCGFQSDHSTIGNQISGLLTFKTASKVSFQNERTFNLDADNGGANRGKNLQYGSEWLEERIE